MRKLNQEPETIEVAETVAAPARQMIRREQTITFAEDTGYGNNFGPRAVSAMQRILKEFLREDNFPKDTMPAFDKDMKVSISLEFH
jgi:hypothetical protein